MKKFIVMLTAIAVATNLAACSKLSTNTVTDEVVHDNMDSEVAKTDTLNDENFTSAFSEYYTDPDTGLEFHMHDMTTSDNYNEYNYVAQHVEYAGPYVSHYLGNSVAYYLKKDSFNENYYNIFEDSYWYLNVSSASCSFFEWLENETEPDSRRCHFKLYKFVLDSSVPSIEYEKKSLKGQSVPQESNDDNETSIGSSIEYTDEQLERYDRYREESDEEFIEDYLTNDLDHYEEDLNTVLEAIDIAIQEAEDEKEASVQARNEGEKIPDSDNIGYLLTYEFTDEDDSDKAASTTRYTLIYGYDAASDRFCVSVDGYHFAKEYSYDTGNYEDTAYDFKSYIAALLSNFVRVTDGEAPQEEGDAKTLCALEDIKFGNTIKIYDKDTYSFSYEPRFDFFDRTDDGIADDTLKEKYFISTYGNVSSIDNGENTELLIKDYQYKDYYATCYNDYHTLYVAIYFKPLLELKPGDAIVRFSIENGTEASTALIEQIIDDLDSMEIQYSYTDGFDEQQVSDNHAEMNVQTGMFKESDVKEYYTYDLFNKVGIQVTVPEFYNFVFENSEGMANVVESLEKTSGVGNSRVSFCFSRFCRTEEDIENKKEYYSFIEECDINGHHCYIMGNEWEDFCSYDIFIEAKPSKYVQIENMRIEGAYFYNKETCRADIKNLISLIDIK